MVIKAKDLKLINEFHQQYWKQDNILQNKKPDIKSFLHGKRKYATAFRLHYLSMFFFRFWRLKYIYSIPTKAEIIKQITL